MGTVADRLALRSARRRLPSIFLPIANRSYQSIAKMRSIQPKIKALKEQYADDKHKFNMEQMELYKREKISPLGGCIPMLLQIPAFFSLYKVLVVTIEMRQAPFFGWTRTFRRLIRPTSSTSSACFPTIPPMWRSSALTSRSGFGRC